MDRTGVTMSYRLVYSRLTLSFLLAVLGLGLTGCGTETTDPPPDNPEQPLAPQGVACDRDETCQSGFCVEGVCCDSACEGGCASCLATNTGGSDGSCAGAHAGLVCRDPAGPCDVVEICSGTSTGCPNDAVVPAGEPGSSPCADSVLCDGASAGCPSDCVDDGDCADGWVCAGDVCTPRLELSLSSSSPILLEGDRTAVEFAIHSSAPAATDLAVDIEISGTASTDDFLLSASPATLRAGMSRAGFTVSAVWDRRVEGDETVVLTLSSAAPGVTIGPDASTTLTLVDDDEEPPARDSLDWLSQDVIAGVPTADPYCVGGGRQEARLDTSLGFIRTDAAGDEGGISVLVPNYNPERQRWESRVLTTFDFRPYAESQPGVGGIPNGADVFEGEGQYVSIVGTNDSGGVAGWASSWGDGCQFFDGWISYDRSNVPAFDPSVRTSWASVSSPISGVSNPSRDNCPDNFGSTTTRWTYVTDFTFAADSNCAGDTGRKVMDTIVSDHDGGNHHEVFYFTDEYGAKSRWERWECGVPYPEHDYITDRCRYSEAQSVMHMAYGVDDDRRTIVNTNGATCYMTDCRDFTSVEVLEPPGYKGAAWHYGAAIYFSGNILRNGDFHSSDDGWDALGTTAETLTEIDGNHYLRISAASTGWHSVLGTSIDEFNRFFDAGGEEAYLPKYLHWGARVRHSGGEGTARLALVEWGNPGGEIIDEQVLSPNDTWQWTEFHRILGAATNGLDLRFRLDGMSGLEVDDVYVYISPEADR